MSEIWLLTGSPGVGKSTVVSKVVLKLKSAGVIVGGFATAEVRIGGVRRGFEIRDLTTGRRGELSSTTSRFGPRVGRYRVNLADLSDVGASGLESAASTSELIVIDEVGPMELVSPEFRRAVSRCIAADKPILAVVHEKMEDDLLIELKAKAKETIVISVDNRDTVVDDLSSKLLAAAGGPKV